MKIKELRWNLGVPIIRVGYRVRSVSGGIGRLLLRYGYYLRGDIPQRTWKRNRI